MTAGVTPARLPTIATAASKEHRVTDNTTSSGADQSEEEVTVETTSVFRSDFLNELDAPASDQR